MLKRVGFSLLMAALRPAVTVAAKVTAPLFPHPESARLSAEARTDATLAIRANSHPLTAALPANPALPLLDVDFCGECLPLDQEHVADRWKRVFTLFKPHARTLGNLRQKADAFFPVIAPIMAKYDIPQDFRYVPLAESGLEPKAVSPMGAAGYWQLMPGTARDLGLKVNGKVDERFNVRKATEAACRYIRALYNQLGSWSLVAAAYNVGPGHIKNQLRRAPDRDYYAMSLPRETRFYLFRVLLYKEVLSRPTEYASFLNPSIVPIYGQG